MKKKLGMLLAVCLVFCMSVGVLADAGKTQQVDYKTDYYMIVESPDGGIDMYSEASVSSPKLNDELIANGTVIHVEGESKDDAGEVWAYAQLHGMFGFVQENYLKPATLSEAVDSELKLFGYEVVNESITVNAKEDKSTSLYKGPGKKYGTVSGGCNIANGEKLYIDQKVDTGEDGVWGHTAAGNVYGWVNIAEATNTQTTTVELVPDNSDAQNKNTSDSEGVDFESTDKASGENAEGSEDVAEQNLDNTETKKADGNTADEPTATPKPTSTPTPKPTATNTPTPSPTPEPTATNTPTPEPTATNTPTPTAEPTATNTATPEPTATDTPTPEPSSTDTPTPEPTEEVTATPAEEASSSQTESSSWMKNPIIWTLLIVILIGIGVVIWLLKKNKKSE